MPLPASRLSALCVRLTLLSDATRLAILSLLSESEEGAMYSQIRRDICGQMSQASTSHCVKLLHVGGCIERVRVGKASRYRLTDYGRAAVGGVMALVSETAAVAA